jgi:uncharacterized protein YaeQ
MSLTATIYTFTIELADVDRSVYETLSLRVARHPSETAEYMLVRVLAYCLEYQEGIELTDGISSGDEAPIVVRDLTGRVTAWIDIGMPDAARLHRARKLADRVAVYTHRDVRQLLGQLSGERIHRAGDIPIYAFDRAFVDEAAAALERRATLSLSITERELFLSVGDRTWQSSVAEHRIDASSQR